MGGHWGRGGGWVICLEEKRASKDVADWGRTNEEGKTAQE